MKSTFREPQVGTRKNNAFMPDFDGLNWKIVQCTLNNMTRPSKSAPSAIPALKHAVIYARVSSKEQEKEGFSIPAQCKLLRDYARQQRFDIVQEFIDVETAKTTGRTNFTEMVKYLRKHPGVRSVLVEKTDRLYRNLKDWVTLDELDVEIHLAKEGVTLSRNSRSSEKFMHGIKVLMAKNYIDNLSEEARKGQMEKAEQGIWPTKAPLGYVNTTGKDGRKVIEPHPELAPVVTQLFERYATGQYSLKALAKAAHGDGLIYPKSGNPVPVSTVHMILRNRLYTGLFQWNGKLHQGQARTSRVDRTMGAGSAFPDGPQCGPTHPKETSLPSPA